MIKFDDDLMHLYQKAAQKMQLEAKLVELQEQRRVYDRNVISLRVACNEEKADVERLEGKSLANYFFNVIGKLDEKLDQERKEAYAAKVKLDAAERELAGIEHDVQDIQSLLADIQIMEHRYQEALGKKRTALKASGTSAGTQILEIEQRIASLQVQKTEIQEAIAAGYSAKGTADRILSELDDADGWNTWDMIGGGGIITHMAKHSHLDEAQDLVQELQSKLRRFKTELADIRISADLQFNIDGFLRFADYFFDGLFTDWAVMDEIHNSKDQVNSTMSQIVSVVNKLVSMESSVDRQIVNLKEQLDEIVVNA